MNKILVCAREIRENTVINKHKQIEKKNAELAKLADQLYTLQHEVTFYKLDNPFSSLENPNRTTSKIQPKVKED